MFNKLIISSFLPKVLAAALLVKRAHDMAGPLRFIGWAEKTGAPEDFSAEMYVDGNDGKEYVVFGGRYSHGGIKGFLIGREGIKRVVSRQDKKSNLLETFVLNDDVSSEVATSLRELIRIRCEKQSIKFVDHSIR